MSCKCYNFCKGWTCDRWSVGAGRVAAAAWAPDSLQLVFATTDEPVLYCLSFQVIFVPFLEFYFSFPGILGRGRGSSPSYGPFHGALAVQVKEGISSSWWRQGINLNIISGEAAGGLVQDLQWEPTGRRLAVSFRSHFRC